MPDTLLEEPFQFQTATPDLMGALSELVEQAQRKRLLLSRSTDFVEMLSVFDKDDREEFWRELHLAVRTPGDALETMLREWQTTAKALGDPLRQEVLLGESGESDYVEVSRPE